MERVVSYFESLPAKTVDSLTGVYFQGSESDAPESVEEKIEALSEDAWGAGIEALVKLWPSDLLSVILKNLRVAFPPDRNPDNRSVMIKSIIYVLEAEGFSVFKDPSYTAEFLGTLITAVVESGKVTKDVSNLEPVLALETLCAETGLLLFFSQFNEKFLSLWCSQIGLELNTASKKLLVSALVSKSKPLKTKAAPKALVSKSKPSLPCSAADAKAWFSRKELADYLASAGLPTSGTVPDLAKRIASSGDASRGMKRVAPVDSDLENEQPNKKLRGHD